MPVSVLHISTSDIAGGAARAAYRIHKCVQGFSTYQSHMLVAFKSSGDPSVTELPRTSQIALRFISSVSSFISKQIFHTHDYLSPSISPFFFIPLRFLEKYDVIHIHWVQSEFFPIWYLPLLRHKKIVWTLHDMWPLLSPFHYPPSFHPNLILSCFTRLHLSLKRKLLPSSVVFHCTTQWMHNQLLTSPFSNHNSCIAPYPLDTDVFRPRTMSHFHDSFGLVPNLPTILFGAIGGNSDPRKGWILLHEALLLLSSAGHKFQALVIGSFPPPSFQPSQSPFPLVYIPPVNDDYVLSFLYTHATVTVVPSSVEAFGQIAAESISCGTPVVAFQGTGTASIINQGISGLLASPLSPSSLSDCIRFYLDSPLSHENQHKCIHQAKSDWSNYSLGPIYQRIYEAL